MNASEYIKAHASFVSQLSETHDNRICSGEVDGILFITKPFYTCRNHERAQVFLGEDGFEFASEWTSIPWNPWKEITVRYWVWLDQTTERKAKAMLEKAQVQGRVEADPYAEPSRYHVWVYSPEAVVALFKITPRIP